MFGTGNDPLLVWFIRRASALRIQTMTEALAQLCRDLIEHIQFINLRALFLAQAEQTSAAHVEGL